MKTWITPTVQELDVVMTENGNVPATYESDYAGKMTIDGIQYCVGSGYVWESGMDMNGYSAVERPFYIDDNGDYVYYN